MLFINQKKSVFRGMLTLALVMFIIASAVQESHGCSTGGELADAFDCEEHMGTTSKYIYTRIRLQRPPSVLSIHNT